MATPYLQQSHGAVVVMSVSVAAFSAGELWQALRLRRGVARADVFGEILFRLLFFVGILLLPLGASVAPGAVVPGGAVGFVIGAVTGWLTGASCRRNATIGRSSRRTGSLDSS